MTDNDKQNNQPEYSLVKPDHPSFNSAGVALIPGTAENWDNRVLGADERHVSVFEANPAELDAALGLVTVKLRMAKTDVDKLEVLAKEKGLILQAYIKSVLAKELNKA